MKRFLTLFSIFSALNLTVAHADLAPDTLTSITVEVNVTGATYPDDLGIEIFQIDFSSPDWSYAKTSANTARVRYQNFYDGNEGPYTGDMNLTFTSAGSGNMQWNYEGPFDGFNSGTFRILSRSGGINNSAAKAAIKRKISKLKKALRKAKKSGNVRLARSIKKKMARLKRQLRSL